MQPGHEPPAPGIGDDYSRLRAQTDRCVKCGLCLPECPTFRLYRSENESPRGRIALIEGLLQGRLGPDPQLLSHLDHCLLCRRCERACPSLVRFGDLMDGTRQWLPGRRAPRLSDLLEHPAAYRLAARFARAVPAALSRPFGRAHRAHRLAVALPGDRPPPASGLYRSLADATHGRVALFTGCATAVHQGDALGDALLLLRAVGYDVDVPAEALCCGALAHHRGDAARADAQARGNRARFGHDIDAVVSIASGCGTRLDGQDPPLPVPHRDICAWLVETGHIAALAFRPLEQPVFLHVPCSVENIYRGGEWAPRLLARIPGLEVVRVGEPGQCCGSAGDYMLRHAETAAALRQPLLDQLDRLAGAQGGILLTGNVGCAMHLADGLGRRSGFEVMHPVQLLARQLVLPGDRAAGD